MQTINSTTPVYIVSAAQGACQEEDVEAHDSLRTLLQAVGIKFKEAKGKYKGKEEHAFVLFNTIEDVAFRLAFDRRRESYMELLPLQDGFYTAVVVDVESGQKYNMGVLGSVNKGNLGKQDFTEIDGAHYAVFPSLNEARNL